MAGKADRYSDGHPLDTVQFLECKVILRPERIVSPKSFFEFGEKVVRTAEEHGIGFDTERLGRRPVRIREVVFLDTKDFRLYNEAFILRLRLPYEDGFPVGDPEVVFKFRHPDMQRAAGVDVRPNVSGDFLIKFKRLDALHQKAMSRCEDFFRALQRDVRDWVSLGTTKTGAVYRFRGNAPNAHE